MNDWKIRTIGVNKTYRFRDRQRRFLDVGRAVDRHEVQAVRSVTLEIPRGQITGVIGANGSGKSTLLRLVAGVTRPTTGTVEVRGTVRGLLELGDNFHSLLTGAENAISDLMLDGLSRRQATDLLGPIGEFAGLQGHLDRPLRSYSTGMRLRLAFATATAVPADIVLIDELLAVGDGHFQEKCIRRLQDLRDGGATILLTSHSIDHVTRLCDGAVWMVEGHAKEIGDAREVADHYNGVLHTTSLESGSAVMPSGTTVHLGAVDVHHARGGRATSITPGAPIQVVVDYEVLAPLDSMIIEVSIQPEGAETALIEANTESDEFPAPCAVGRHRIALQWDRLDLGGGRYHVHVGAYSAAWRTTLAYAWEATSVNIAGDESASAICPPRNWSISAPSHRAQG